MTKISDLTALTGAGVDMTADLMPIVDMSEAGVARNKKITLAELKIALGVTTYTDEQVRDVIAAALVNGTNITITPNDGSDTITIDAAAGGGLDAEAVMDLVADLLTQGSNVTLTYNDGADTLEIASSSAGGSHRGALVRKSADQTAANYSAGAFVSWDAEEYDTDTIHDTVTNNSRLTVPAGVSKVRLSATIAASADTSDTWKILQITKGGSADWFGAGAQTIEIGAVGIHISCISAVVNVTPGDYFEARFQTESDTSITIEHERSWFQMEIVD